MSSPSILLLLPLFYSLLTLIQAYETQPLPLEPYRTPLPGYEYQKALAQQKAHNLIDSCWRRDPSWSDNRQDLADCAKGFGSGAFGGKGGAIYVVTDDSDDHANPKPGTLRYGAIQEEPLWIIFQRDMSIKLEKELLVKSFKTIDGRGANVAVGNGGPCLAIERARHVIIHGISVVDCKPGYPEMFQNGSSVGSSDGDAISVVGSSKIWIDHCLLARAADKLIDVTLSSTGITISNNLFTEQDKVIMLGDSDHYVHGAVMEVTVMFNHFGYGCLQGMPRVRFGYAHVANNKYTKWGKYAMGGSSSPTIMSEGNHFLAPDETQYKQVTRREMIMPGDHWQTWKWRSSKDVFLNGAYFVQSGASNTIVPLNVYTTYQAFPVASGDDVPSLTIDAGPLPCVEREIC